VKSPDRLLDLVTRKHREVDASIRYKVGTTEILIIIECRERAKNQDSVWIEQLATKQRHVGAAKCIAVTSSGFTAPAIAKANSLGIELRHIKKIDDDVILKWAPLRTWSYHYTLESPSLAFLDANGEYSPDRDEELNVALAEKHYLEDRILISKETSSSISVTDYILDLVNRAISEMPVEKRQFIPMNKPLLMSFAGSPQYCVECFDTLHDVSGAAFWITFKNFVEHSLKPTAAYTYSNEVQELALGLELDTILHDGTAGKLTVYTDLASKRSRVTVTDSKKTQS